MLDPEDIRAVARAVHAQLDNLLPNGEARQASAELSGLLDRAERGEDVTAQLLKTLRAREATCEATFALLRGERAAAFQPLLGVPADVGGRYACPVAHCRERSARLDDSEPTPRCPAHDVAMQRL